MGDTITRYSLSHAGTDVECVNGMFLFARPVRFVRVVYVVKPWFTSSTVGGLHIIRET